MELWRSGAKRDEVKCIEVRALKQTEYNGVRNGVVLTVVRYTDLSSLPVIACVNINSDAFHIDTHIYICLFKIF